jgi:integrase
MARQAKRQAKRGSCPRPLPLPVDVLGPEGSELLPAKAPDLEPFDLEDLEPFDPADLEALSLEAELRLGALELEDLKPFDLEAELAALAGEALAVPVHVGERAKDYARQAAAPNTVRAYRSDWRAFEGWAGANGKAALPCSPITLALYATWLAESGKRCSTIGRALSAINHAQRAAGHPSVSSNVEPLHSVWRGIRRCKGTAPGQKAPLLVVDLRAAVGALPATVRGQRDKALLLLGFAGAFRRSELVALDVADLETGSEGLTVRLRRSKTDQEGQGSKVGVPFGRKELTCPVRALADWLEAAGIHEGAVFRPITKGGRVLPGRLTDRAVALAVKRAALAGRP